MKGIDHLPLALGEGGILVGLVLGIPLAIALAAWTRWRDRRNVPAGELRRELVDEVRELAAQGRGYHELKQHLRGRGLRGNVAEGLLADVERRQRADTNSPRTAARGGIEFQYPSNWRLQGLDPAMDPELGFSVEGTSSAVAIFVVSHVPESPVPELQQLLSDQCREIRGSEQESFHALGVLRGQGRVLQGTVMKQPIQARVFRCEPRAGMSLAVVFSCLDEDLEDAQPGFELVESTLRVSSEAVSSP